MKKINLKFAENFMEFFKEENNLDKIYNKRKFDFIYVNKLNLENISSFNKNNFIKKEEILYINLYNLLNKDTGIIAVQIEEKELKEKKHVLDKIFEKNNYIGQYIRRKNEIIELNDYFPIENNNDYILLYSRNKKKIKELIKEKSIIDNKEEIINIFKNNNKLLKFLFKENNLQKEENKKFPYFYKDSNGIWKYEYKDKIFINLLKEKENNLKNYLINEIKTYFDNNIYIKSNNLLTEYTNELEIVELLNDFNIYKNDYLKNLLFNLNKYKKYLEETPYSLYYKIFNDLNIKENSRILNFGTRLGNIIKGSIKYLENNDINNLSIELIINTNKYNEINEENKLSKILKIFSNKEKIINYKLFINKRYKNYQGNIKLNWENNR